MTAFTENPPVRPYGPPVDQDDLVKVTVWIVPTAIEAMNAAAERSGDTRTDTINRALIWYDHSTRNLFRWVLRWVLIIWGCLLPSQLWANLTDVNWRWDMAFLAVSALIALPVAFWLNWRPKGRRNPA